MKDDSREKALLVARIEDRLGRLTDVAIDFREGRIRMNTRDELVQSTGVQFEED